MLNTVYTAHWLLYYVYNWKITIFYDLFMHASMHPPHSASTLLSCLVLREEPTTRIIFQNVNGRIRLETRKWNFLFMTMHFFYLFFLCTIFYKIYTINSHFYSLNWDRNQIIRLPSWFFARLDSFFFGSFFFFDILKKVLKIFEISFPHFDNPNIDKLCFEYYTRVG